MAIKDWSTTAANNNSNPPNGFPEGMAPSAVNDAARQVMADVRAFYDEIEWRDLGHSHTYASGTSTTIAGTDYTATYPANLRVRAVGSTTGTIYGTISSSSFSTNTAVNYTWDSGSLQNETLAISVGFPISNSPIHVAGVEDGADVGGNNTFTGTNNFTGALQVSGTAVATTVTTTRGDLIARGASADGRLAVGAADEVLASDGTDPVWRAKQVLASEVATTSGTAVTVLSSIPAWAKRITIMLEGISTSGTSPIELRLGDSGGFESSGYSGVCNEHGGSGTNVTSNSAGFLITRASIAAQTFDGRIELTLKDASNNTWCVTSSGAYNTEVFLHQCMGFKSLSGALTQLQLTTSGGSDTFDAGDVAVLYD